MPVPACYGGPALSAGTLVAPGPNAAGGGSDQRGTLVAVTPTELLLEWSVESGRDLPWRRTRDPWSILVAEVMLQQTQVARVVSRWSAFLDRFPTVVACATAEAADVIDEWAGLGYNRRAVALHRLAVECSARHGARIPDSLDALLGLPGVGRYTARAVLVFAFERRVGVLDTNVGRVLARRCGRPLRPAQAQGIADAAVPDGSAWAWNQAMLDLGALVCTARTPRCGSCPLAEGCAWFTAGRPEPDPATGSAGVGRGQSPFDGSNRQGRGRLVDALRRRGHVAADEVAATAGWPDDEPRARGVAKGLVIDGLAVDDGAGGLLRAGSTPRARSGSGGGAELSER